MNAKFEVIDLPSFAITTQRSDYCISPDLEQARDAYYKSLGDLVKTKPNKDTMDQVARDLQALETSLRIAREDLVRPHQCR